MFNTISNKRGISLIEACVALFLLSVGVLALISLQASAWRLSGKSDYLGRASGILVAQLQASEAKIMNPNIAIPTGGSSPVYASGQDTARQGDVAFTVNTTITPVAGMTNLWSVNVKVTWPGNAAGISESLNVTRQEYFRQ